MLAHIHLDSLTQCVLLAELSTAQLRKMHQTCLEYAHPFCPVDVADFLSRTLEKREWIIAGKVPKGSTIALIADAGADW